MFPVSFKYSLAVLAELLVFKKILLVPVADVFDTTKSTSLFKLALSIVISPVVIPVVAVIFGADTFPENEAEASLRLRATVEPHKNLCMLPKEGV